MIKCRKTKEDPYLGLLNFHNTPTGALSASLAELKL